MARTVAIGHQDFETVRKNDYFYIDKTDFIREWWENGDSVTLITRPRRFGKTLNMSMLEKFFSVNYAGRADLFEGLDIWKQKKFREIQGTYPVISLSFAGIKETTFLETRKKICQTITEVYNKCDFLMDSDLLNEKEKAFIQEISVDMEDYAATSSLKVLSDYLSRYYGKKVIILLDEYDTPMQEAYVNGFWEELVAFTRSLFNSTFKTNPYLERAIMTGITRVSKESIFSDLNNLEVVTTTSDKYENAFGFTEQEVFATLEEFQLSENKQDVKNWYDGFTFGKVSDIYNPWSIINYIDKKKLTTYWANTSSNSLVNKLIREGSSEIKQDFEELLKGGVLETVIDEQIVFSQLSTKESAIWSLLLACGYLKVVQYTLDEPSGREYYVLALTNKEVRIMFQNMIRDWFSEEEPGYNNFIKALLADNLDAMNEYMNRVAMATFSYFDTGKNSSVEEPERLPTGKAITKGLKGPNPSDCFYHGLVLGLMVDLAGRYVITSNRESGFGRYDVILEPLSRQDDAMILEFKVFRPKKEKSLEDTVKYALEQIEDKNYAASLTAKGFPEEQIRKYGFAFRGKEVLIG